MLCLHRLSPLSSRRSLALIITIFLVFQIHPVIADDRAILLGGRPFLDVQEPEALSIMEKDGLSLGSVLGHPEADTNRHLFEVSQAFRDIVQHVDADVSTTRDEAKAERRELRTDPIDGMGRTMDLKWLRSSQAHFQLIGVVNRLDRRDFLELDSANRSCGEIRLIYRLAYRIEPGWWARLRGAKPRASRMPFNLNLVHDFRARDSIGCARMLEAVVPQQDLRTPTDVANWIISNPFRQARLRQVELNAQVARMPSEIEPEFGGQAFYLMRVVALEQAGATLTAIPKPLENTPNLGLLMDNEDLRQELIAYIRANAASIRQGVYQLPEKFLDTKAISVSTSGSSRKANRPFTSIFDEDDLQRLGPSGPDRRLQEVLERLDAGTCMGCHQTNATAGFHFIGFDRDEVHRNNRVKHGISPHYHAELARRAAYMVALIDGKSPDRFRPLPSAPPAHWQQGKSAAYEPADLGMPCPLQASDQASWICRSGTTCQAVVQNDELPVAMGQCLSKNNLPSAGLSCMTGKIRNGTSPLRDRLQQARQGRIQIGQGGILRPYFCLPPKLGVPGGLHHRACSAAERSFEGFRDGRPNEICGMGGGRTFDLCAASGDFASCLDASIVRTMRQTCGGGHFCREDYMCQEMPKEPLGTADIENLKSIKDLGYCSPTYFLFQMRIDGHPRPS
jgi:hypothetical protein